MRGENYSIKSCATHLLDCMIFILSDPFNYLPIYLTFIWKFSKECPTHLPDFV